MNAKQIIAVVSLALAGSATMADELTVFVDPVSTLSRAEVRAELDRARAEGTLPVGGEDAVVIEQPVAATATRQEVRAEARTAALSHRFDDLYTR